MNCFVHERSAAVGICAACQKAICRPCVGREAPRLLCTPCAGRGGILGFEYKSKAMIGTWPLLHICAGVDAATMRPKVARGVIALGNIAVGGIAIGGVALGLITFAGVSIGLLFALGGMAIGLGLSFGGVAVGAVAIGGGAVGYLYAVGGGAIAPAYIDGRHCDAALRDLIVRYGGRFVLPPNCRP